MRILKGTARSARVLAQCNQDLNVRSRRMSENSPPIYGWVPRSAQNKSRQGRKKLENRYRSRTGHNHLLARPFLSPLAGLENSLTCYSHR